MKRTFGCGRITVLAGLFNITILLTVIVSIIYQAYYRFFNPGPIEGITVIVVGLLRILINGAVAVSLFNERHNFTIKTALFNLTLDVLASLGALVSGIVITLTNKTFIDPLISITIAGILLINTFKILTETIDILLESVPKHLSIKDIETCIKEFKAVKKIDNLHLWSIANNQAIMMCNIYLDYEDFVLNSQISQKIKKRLQEHFNLQHITIEVTADEPKNIDPS